MDAMRAQLPVHYWPGALPVLTDDICVIAVRTGAGQQRAQARQQIRLALREALAGLLKLNPATIEISNDAGRPPRLIATGPLIPSHGCSISHEGGLSLAAINLRGAIGVDLMRVQPIPDWAALARDYLGAAAAAALAATPPAQRAAALARAWTAHEASLKCLGLELQEWDRLKLRPCRQIGLALPDGYAGAISIPA